MQGAGATAEITAQEVPPVPNTPPQRDDERVSHWVQKGFLALLGTGAMLLVSGGTWLVGSVNDIRSSTSIIAVEFATTKRDIAEMKMAVDNLRLRGENWATKDQVNGTREAIMSQITTLKDQVNILELRVQRLETK